MTPEGRKTTRLTEQFTAMGLALGGSAGVRLGRKFGLVACRNTLLNVIRHAPVPPVVTPSVLGVDDWAKLAKKVPSAKPMEDQRRGCASAIPTGPCWWTSNSAARWRCCRAARRTRWPHGCASTPVST